MIGPAQPATLRLFIDHPDGVTLALCERVSGQLNDYRDRYSLEVSSPGQDRPLTKPQHYTRFLGRRARVRLREAPDGHKSLTGELVGASDSDVTIAARGRGRHDPLRADRPLEPRTWRLKSCRERSSRPFGASPPRRTSPTRS